MFVSVAVETMGAFGYQSLSFIKDLGRRLKYATDEPMISSAETVSGNLEGQRSLCLGVTG